MKLEERKENILDFIVRDYVEGASPVSSGKINRSYKPYRMSPATIRAIMGELDEEGYLAQPHTSAGRVPTKKGYQYFIEYLISTTDPNASLRRECEECVDDVEELTDMLARHLRAFTMISVFDIMEHRMRRGLPEVLRQPEFYDHRMTTLFAEAIEELDSALPSMKTHQPHVTINQFSMISTSFENRAGRRYTIASLGPQRMDYEKAHSLMNYLYKTYTNHEIYA